MTVATATPTLGPEIVAKRNGSCPQCPEPIVKGESYIRAVVGCGKQKWMHGDCAAAYVRHREHYQELNEELDAEETGRSAGREGAGE